MVDQDYKWGFVPHSLLREATGDALTLDVRHEAPLVVLVHHLLQHFLLLLRRAQLRLGGPPLVLQRLRRRLRILEGDRGAARSKSSPCTEPSEPRGGSLDVRMMQLRQLPVGGVQSAGLLAP